MKASKSLCLQCLFTCLLLFIAARVKADDSGILDRIIRLPKSEMTVYNLLSKITEETGYLFIYDSKLVDNERTVKLKGGKQTVRQAIYSIIGNDNLKLRSVDKHIIIYRPETTLSISKEEGLCRDSTLSFTLEGTLIDQLSREPIPYATVGAEGSSIGSVTNQNGSFRLHLPDSLRNGRIRFSHLGYVPQTTDASLLAGRNGTFALEPKVIPLQEVIVRIVNPVRLLREMLQFRKKNYSKVPVYLTSFYREGIEQKNRFVSLTEGIFKIYKASSSTPEKTDQVKLLKMRRITNQAVKDTLIAKMKSGIHASIELDLIKSLPDFLLPDSKECVYVYTSSDLAVIDNRLAHVVSFEQRPSIKYPYYCGELYIDSENSALLRARFELTPRYIHKAANMLVEKRSRNIRIIPQKVVYTVSYKPWKQTYYIHHVRGDLHFRIKQKNKWLNNTILHTWFEMVTCKIETDNVSRFDHNERLSVHTIFAEIPFVYDKSFWEDFNVIPPEKELSEAIEKISSKIEETEN